MARTVTEVDQELTRAVNRRVNGRARISVLSQCIVADTALIDQLLAERARLSTTTTNIGVPSGR